MSDQKPALSRQCTITGPSAAEILRARDAKINYAGRRGMNSFADVERALMDCAVAVGYGKNLTAESFDVVGVIADEVQSAVAERDRLRGELEDKNCRLEPDGAGGFRWEAADLEAQNEALRRLLADVEPFIGWLAQVPEIKERVRAALERSRGA